MKVLRIKMKTVKLIGLILTLCMVISLSSCTKKTKPSDASASGSTSSSAASPSESESLGETSVGETGGNSTENTTKAGGSNTTTQKPNPATTTKNTTQTPSVSEKDKVLNGSKFFGVGEPLYYRAYGAKDIDIDKSVELLAEMGCQTIRLWTEFGQVFNNYNPKSVNKNAVAAYKSLVKKLNDKGISVIGMCHSFAFNNTNWNSLPAYDKTAGSQYQKFLDYWEESWQALARELPEIEFWQIANETNADVYLHPVGYPEKTFSGQEKVEITLELLYRGAKGVRASNKNAVVIMGGLSPYSGMHSGNVEDFLDTMYYGIESGKFGSSKRKDFFDVLAWHPYNLGTNGFEPIDQKWVDSNKRIYNVAEKHGDKNVPVFFTEFGYTDFGSSSTDKAQEAYMVKAFDYIKKQMPFVKVVNAFRLYNDPSAFAWGGDGEVNFGMFDQKNGKIIPKRKAFAFITASGSKGNISKYN